MKRTTNGYETENYYIKRCMEQKGSKQRLLYWELIRKADNHTCGFSPYLKWIKKELREEGEI